MSGYRGAKLVQSIAAGDQLALHALYEMAHRSVFTLIIRITANWETAEGTVPAWIMNQARSRAIDRLRFDNRKKRRDG